MAVEKWTSKGISLWNLAIVFLPSHFIYLLFLYQQMNLTALKALHKQLLFTYTQIHSIQTKASFGHCIFFLIFFFTFLLSSLLSAASKALQHCLSSHVKLWMLIILRAVRVSTRRQTFYGRGGSKLDPFSCDLPGTYCPQVPYGAGTAKPTYISVF